MLITLAVPESKRASQGNGMRIRCLTSLLTAETLSRNGLLRRLRKNGFTVSLRTLANDLTQLAQELGPRRFRQYTRSDASEIPDDCMSDRSFFRIEGTRRHSVTNPGTLVLGEDEMLALDLARQILAGSGTGPNPLAEALNRLADRLGVRVRDTNTTDEVVIGRFGHQPFSAMHLTLCLEALRLERWLTLHYEPTGAPFKERLIVAPKRLVLIDGEWYLAGWSRTAGEVCLLKFACITNLELARPSAAKPPPDLRRQIDGAIALAFRSCLTGRPQRVVLRISDIAFAQLATRTWGKDQRITANHWRGTSLPHRLIFTTGGLDAVLAWLLQFSGHAVALSPATLRAQVMAAAKRTIAAHDSAPDQDIPLNGIDDADQQEIDYFRRAVVQVDASAVESGIVGSVEYVLRNPPPRKQQMKRRW